MITVRDPISSLVRICMYTSMATDRKTIQFSDLKNGYMYMYPRLKENDIEIGVGRGQ
jgi:hypothetical protein